MLVQYESKQDIGQEAKCMRSYLLRYRCDLCYHRSMDYIIYKKGLDDREIFSEQDDYELWERLVAEYLSPYHEEIDSPYKGLRPYQKQHKQDMNLFGKIQLLAYCLMPTYIYMVVRENQKGALTALMRRVTTYYSMIYNRKRKRSGYVFAGSFKCKKISGVNNLGDTIRLVHEIPASKTVRRFGVVQTTTGANASEYPFSSNGDYVSGKPREWVTVIDLPEPVKGIESDKLPW